jgi:hypothetical protein
MICDFTRMCIHCSNSVLIIIEAFSQGASHLCQGRAPNTFSHSECVLGQHNLLPRTGLEVQYQTHRITDAEVLDAGLSNILCVSLFCVQRV